MRETVTIPLSKPLTGHDGLIKQVVLREPTFDEYLQIGDPYTVAESGDGTPFAVENIEVIKQYLDLCLVEPSNVLLLAQSNALTARKVKSALLGFFRPAEAADADSGTSPTTSSSAASAPASSAPSAG